jgi:hypothetical protein
MMRVGGLKSLQSVLGKFDFIDTPLELHTWLRSEIGLVSPYSETTGKRTKNSHPFGPKAHCMANC